MGESRACDLGSEQRVTADVNSCYVCNLIKRDFVLVLILYRLPLHPLLLSLNVFHLLSALC